MLHGISLLVDLFGYLAIIVHGLVIIGQSVALGSVFFLVFLAGPRGWLLGMQGRVLVADTLRIAIWGALGLVLGEALTLALEGSVLAGTVDLALPDLLGAEFAIAGMVKIAASLLLALLLGTLGARVPALLLLPLAAVILAAGAATTHAAARIDNRAALLAVSALHQLGAAIWIGGIPAFVAGLARIDDAASARVIGERFSRMSMLGVACILASGGALSWFYIGDFAGFYGTAYGVMVGAKIALFLMLLALGYGNFRSVARLGGTRGDRQAPALRLRRFAEAEIGIGFSIFFAAASLTSVPPAIDLTQDRVSLGEIVEPPPSLKSGWRSVAAAVATCPHCAVGCGPKEPMRTCRRRWGRRTHSRTMRTTRTTRTS